MAFVGRFVRIIHYIDHHFGNADLWNSQGNDNQHFNLRFKIIDKLFFIRQRRKNFLIPHLVIQGIQCANLLMFIAFKMSRAKTSVDNAMEDLISSIFGLSEYLDYFRGWKFN